MNNQPERIMLPNKKIIFLITSLSLAGAQTQLVCLATTLRKRGWSVKIISMISPQAFFPDLIVHDIPVYSLYMQRGRIDFGVLFRLAEILKKECPDILHCHMVHANLLGRIVRLFVSIPVVISSAHNENEGGWERNWWYRLTDYLCNITTQVSKAGVQRYVNKKLVPFGKIVFIPNGVDLKTFRKNEVVRQEMRHTLEISSNFVWLAVGRLDLSKDYRNMINAFSKVYEDCNNCILLIVGDGILRSELEGQAKLFGIENKIKFLGIRKDVPDLMSAADAYVMSSAWEGMPCVLLEASACELPVVATEVGGNGEIVKQGETGFLVPLGQPKRLANAMLAVMNLPVNKRLEIGQAGRIYMEEAYSLEFIVGKWEELYRNLMLKNQITL